MLRRIREKIVLTEAQMDINDYWPCKHFSANLGLSRRTLIQVSEWEGLAHPLPADHPGSLGARNHPPPPEPRLTSRETGSSPPGRKTYGWGRRLGLPLSLS